MRSPSYGPLIADLRTGNALEYESLGASIHQSRDITHKAEAPLELDASRSTFQTQIARKLAMEALSVLGSIIAIAQAGDRLIDLIEKARPFIRASKEVDELRDEVLDLTGLLKDLDTCIRELHSSKSLPPDQTEGLERLLKKAEKAVSALEDIVNTVKGPGRVERDSVDRIAWMRKISKVKRLQEHLHHIRLTMLGYLQSFQM